MNVLELTGLTTISIPTWIHRILLLSTCLPWVDNNDILLVVGFNYNMLPVFYLDVWLQWDKNIFIALVTYIFCVLV